MRLPCQASMRAGLRAGAEGSWCSSAAIAWPTRRRRSAARPPDGVPAAHGGAGDGSVLERARGTLGKTSENDRVAAGSSDSLDMRVFCDSPSSSVHSSQASPGARPRQTRPHAGRQRYVGADGHDAVARLHVHHEPADAIKVEPGSERTASRAERTDRAGRSREPRPRGWPARRWPGESRRGRWESAGEAESTRLGCVSSARAAISSAEPWGGDRRDRRAGRGARQALAKVRIAGFRHRRQLGPAPVRRIKGRTTRNASPINPNATQSDQISQRTASGKTQATSATMPRIAPHARPTRQRPHPSMRPRPRSRTSRRARPRRIDFGKAADLAWAGSRRWSSS